MIFGSEIVFMHEFGTRALLHFGVWAYKSEVGAFLLRGIARGRGSQTVCTHELICTFVSVKIL